MLSLFAAVFLPALAALATPPDSSSSGSNVCVASTLIKDPFLEIPLFSYSILLGDKEVRLEIPTNHVAYHLIKRTVKSLILHGQRSDLDDIVLCISPYIPTRPIQRLELHCLLGTQAASALADAIEESPTLQEVYAGWNENPRLLEVLMKKCNITEPRRDRTYKWIPSLPEGEGEGHK